MTLRSFIIAVAGCVLLGAQEQPSEPLVLKSTTRLVQVNVIADDLQGRPVADLRKEDFQIKVEGKVQPISVFAVNSTAPFAASAALSHVERPLPANVFTNRLERNESTASGVTIILLDARNTAWADLVYAKAEIVRYLRNLQPGDHVGLYVFGASLGVLHDYTANSADLLDRLETYRQGQQLPDTSAGEPPGAIQDDVHVLDGWKRAVQENRAEQAFYTSNNVVATLRVLEFIASHLARVSGRKNLIWVSGGFPLCVNCDQMGAKYVHNFNDEARHTERLLNDANIAIYPVDARGLMYDPRFDASHWRPQSGTVGSTPPIGVVEHQTMDELAGTTGGRAFYNGNDLSHAIQRAVDDSRVTYTLGFYPEDEKLDGKFHEIKIHLVERRGLKLRYRKGYVARGDDPQDVHTRDKEMVDAVWSPIDATALSLLARVDPGSKAGSVDVTVKVDHTDISLQRQQDRWVGRLDILYVQKDDRGDEYGNVSDKIDLRLKEANYQTLMTEDFLYQRSVERNSKADFLRIVVRDAASGSIGSITVPLAEIRR